MEKNTTATIMMIRPVRFRFNEQTAVNNYYQKVIDGITAENAQASALVEFDDFVAKLRTADVDVIVIEDTMEPNTPDSIFPNNWVSFHAEGTVVLYPMFANNRRLERRDDVLDKLKKLGFVIHNTVDLTDFENKGEILEGTGSLVLDRVNKMAYGAISERTNEKVIDQFDHVLGYQTVVFTAFQNVNNDRLPIYHTNVMMCMGDEFVVICLDSIDDMDERMALIESFEDFDKEVIEISEEQKEHFAGNMLQVENKKGERLMVMSQAAYLSLDD